MNNTTPHATLFADVVDALDSITELRGNLNTESLGKILGTLSQTIEMPSKNAPSPSGPRTLSPVPTPDQTLSKFLNQSFPPPDPNQAPIRSVSKVVDALPINKTGRVSWPWNKMYTGDILFFPNTIFDPRTVKASLASYLSSRRNATIAKRARRPAPKITLHERLDGVLAICKERPL